MNAFGRSFLPGPTDVRPDIFQAMLEPMYFHRGPRMQALLAEMQPQLQELFGTTRPVFLETLSASGLAEAAIRNGVRHRVLVVVSGFFGELFATIAEGCGKEVIRAMVPPGSNLTPEGLAKFLEGPPVDAVALVHSESSTGALAPLPALARVVRDRPDTMLLVDAVTSVGAMEVQTDAWGIDFIFTGSQKALALPPGIAAGVASARLAERAATLPDRGWYASVPNLLQIVHDGLPTHTPALPLYHALARQLRDIAASGGWPARWARHTAMRVEMEEWTARRGDVRLAAPAGVRSPAISAVQLPEGHEAPAVLARLADAGWAVALGLPPLTDRILRIGHMGDLTVEHLRALLRALDGILDGR